MDVTKKIQSRPPEVLSIEDVRKRIPLLKRVIKDAVECYDSRKKAKEFLDELSVISRKFSSSEIEETMNSLRRQVNDSDRGLQAFEKETRELGGILKDPSRGLAYFFSERDNRKVFLIWEMGEPDLISWHELDETFSDRLPVEFPAEARASAGDFPEGG